MRAPISVRKYENIVFPPSSTPHYIFATFIHIIIVFLKMYILHKYSIYTLFRALPLSLFEEVITKHFEIVPPCKYVNKYTLFCINK